MSTIWWIRYQHIAYYPRLSSRHELQFIWIKSVNLSTQCPDRVAKKQKNYEDQDQDGDSGQRRQTTTKTEWWPLGTNP